MDSPPPASTDARTETSQYVCALSYNALNVQNIIGSVQNNAAGAVSVFIGTTRNSFQGKTVTRLVYQAYSRLAIKTLSSVAASVIKSLTRSVHQPTSEEDNVPATIRCAIHHRLGDVPVGEASIVVAVATPHRKEAFDACERILEEVKKRAQIWKKEYYNGENENEAEWKTNT